MKKLIFTAMLALFVVYLLAQPDIMQPTIKMHYDKSIKFVPSSVRSQDLRVPPTYNFAINPIDLGGTIYDYMPGSYNGFPLKFQADYIDESTGELISGGLYFIYHMRQNSTSNRRVHYAYIDTNGNIIANSTISSDDLWEGYAGFDIDRLTSDPIVAWHVDVDADQTLDDNMSWDAFHIASFPGLFLDPPYTVINNTQLINQGITETGDSFIWPDVKIGDSPITGKRRVYINARNSNESTGIVSKPSENALLAYADFSAEDINAMTPDAWDWHYRTIPQMDDWHHEIPEFARPFYTFLVNNNYVIYLGELIYSEASETSPKLFALINDNYGEGDFEYVEFDYGATWLINDVLNQDNSAWLYGGEAGAAQLKWGLGFGAHNSAVFTDNTHISFSGALVLNYYDTQADPPGWYYKPGWGQVYVKEFTFDLFSHEFGVVDVYPPDLSPISNNTPVVPWDLDGNGEVDGYDADGNPEWIPSLPVFHPNLDNVFNYNLIKITQNRDRNWYAMVWNDCYEAYLNDNDIEGYEDWEGQTKVMISIRNGRNWIVPNWSTPIIMDAKENDEHFISQFQGMIPSYVYPADKIEEISANYGKLHLFFLNDDSYGSSIMIPPDGANPDPDNCRLEYTVLNIDMTSGKVGDDNLSPNVNIIDAVNYPNPFNPITTIKYNVPLRGNVRIDLYNILGQKIRTLVNTIQKAGENSVIWDGTNDNGDIVASGVYMYKIKNGKHTSTKKMILMK